MTLSFEAKFVDCSDAIDGEILQVDFDTVPATFDEDERRTPYLLVSYSSEFPDPATVEWHDGADYDGGGEVVSIRLERDRVSMKLGGGAFFCVTFKLSEKAFTGLELVLRKMIEDRVWQN